MIQSAKLKNGDRVEMVVEIYESADSIRSQEEPVYANTKENSQTQHKAGVMKRFYRSILVCMALLCVLLLAVITALSIRLYMLTAERHLEQTSWVKEREARMNWISNNVAGWIYYNSSFYNMSSTKMSWNDGRQKCKENDADLVVINSREEQDFIEKLRKGEEVWIGLTDSDLEGVWKWVDNSTLANGYWWTGEPNNYQGIEHCAISGYRNAKNVSSWADYHCNHNAIWICEMKLF